MASEQQSEQGRTAATDDPRVTATYRVNSSVMDQFKQKCKQVKLPQSSVIEACIEAFLENQIIVFNGKVSVNN